MACGSTASVAVTSASTFFDDGGRRSGRGYESLTVNDSNGLVSLVHYPKFDVVEARDF